MKNETKNDYALPFAAWELRLYLDTHPNDERAFAAYKQLCASQGCNYACNVIGERDDDSPSCGCTVSTPAPFCAVPGNIRTPVGYSRQNPPQQNHSANKGCGGRVWHWIDDPWPWEPEANIRGGHF